MAITGGSVTFEQSRKLAEYENRKVSITFNVTDEQDGTEQVLKALDLAEQHVLTALGLKPSDTSEKPRRGRPPKTPPATAPAEAPKPAAPASSAADMTALDAPQIRTNPENRTDPAQMDESIFTAAEPEKPKTITDVELLGAIQRKAGALSVSIGQEAPVRVRTLIGKYAKSAKEIPADKRPDFLDELAALAA